MEEQSDQIPVLDYRAPMVRKSRLPFVFGSIGDFVVGIVVGLTYLLFFGRFVNRYTFGISIIPPVLLGIVWLIFVRKISFSLGIFFIIGFIASIIYIVRHFPWFFKM